MGRRKKNSNYLALGIKYFFIGIFWLIKNLILGTFWVLHYFYIEIKNLFKKQTKIVEIPNKNPTITENKTLAIRSNSAAVNQEFKIIKSLKGDYLDFENQSLTKDSTIGIILGARGTGKSALGLKILENYHYKTGKTVYTMGFKSEEMPSWIHNIVSVDEVKNNSFVLLDESGITFSSRESMSNINKLLSNLLLISRHKDLNLLFITQNSSNIDLNIIRQADYLLLKPSSLLQKDFERKKINDIYKEVDKTFKEFKDEKGLTYIYSEIYRGFISNPLPSFWNEKVSKAYRGK